MRRSTWFFAMIAALLASMSARADDTPSPGAAPPQPPIAPPRPPIASPPTTPPPTTPPPTTPTARTPPPPPPAQSAISPPSPPPSAVQSVAPEAAEAILGQRVTDPEGQDIGRLVDVLVDANGQPQAGVIDFGGFMGVGNRKVAVHWSVLHFNPGDPKHKVTLDMTPDQIKDAPEFSNSNKAASVVTPTDTSAASP